MPPRPSSARIRYRPIVVGSDAPSGFTGTPSTRSGGAADPGAPAIFGRIALR
jgi:hypothetical protein